jgi:hypothetical protein
VTRALVLEVLHFLRLIWFDLRDFVKVWTLHIFNVSSVWTSGYFDIIVPTVLKSYHYLSLMIRAHQAKLCK